MDTEFCDSTTPSKLEKSKPSLVNAQGAPILVEGLIIEHSEDIDIFLGKLDLDLTSDFETAILIITEILKEGKVLTLYPKELSTYYLPVVEEESPECQ